MDKELKLSVLVTFCNQKEFIRDALNSIFNQKTDFEYEVLVGLDGEDPESEKIIKEYPVKLFKCDNSKLDIIPIEKASNNRINILKHAQGEYFCFLDGDDFYINNSRFQTLIDILDKNKKLIGCAHHRIHFDNKTQSHRIVQSRIKEESVINLKNYLEKQIYISSNEFIFRNIFFNCIPEDFPNNFLDDVVLTSYMLKYGSIYYIPIPMYARRINIESIFESKQYNIKRFYALLIGEICSKILPEYPALVCKKYKRALRKCLLLNTSGCELIRKSALYHSCYFTYYLLNYKNIKLKEKFCLWKNIFLYFFFNIQPVFTSEPQQLSPQSEELTEDSVRL